MIIKCSLGSKTYVSLYKGSEEVVVVHTEVWSYRQAGLEVSPLGLRHDEAEHVKYSPELWHGHPPTAVLVKCR